ncbi:unnamed protein product [Victoria cruziana]
MAVYTQYPDSCFPAFSSEPADYQPIGVGGFGFSQQEQQEQEYRSSKSGGPLPITCDQVVDAFFEKQKQEIDEFIVLQGERLREELEARRREQLQAVMRRVEAGVSALMGEREARMEGELRRGAELQELLRRAETERAVWQRLAREREAAAAALANALDRLRSCSPSPAPGDDEDAESCCAAEKDRQEEADAPHRLPATSLPSSAAACRACGDRPARVVMLPCRHLCACGACGSSVRTCPVCGSAKRAVLEVFFV